ARPCAARSLVPRPPTSTLFPYTTLFRSHVRGARRPRHLALGHGVRAIAREIGVLTAQLRGQAGCQLRAQFTDRDTDIAIAGHEGDRKSTRLNSSHLVISYAVFCLKKKNT